MPQVPFAHPRTCPLARVALVLGTGLLAVLLLAPAARAARLEGSINTSTPDGGFVNQNVFYPNKLYVYLDGGPGPNAPPTASGLAPGIYVYQVTDPSGKFLLSMDPSKCRLVEVGGPDQRFFTNLVLPSSLGLGLSDDYAVGHGNNQENFPCHIADPPNPPVPAGPDDFGPSGRHDTNVDQDWGGLGAIVVQLMPYGTTPNPGGVYKAWIMPLVRYLANGGELDEVPGQATGPGKKDCPDFCANRDPAFRGDQIKTDNYKVEGQPPVIRVRKFEDVNGNGVWDDVDVEIFGWEITIWDGLFDGGMVPITCFTPCEEVVAPNTTVIVEEELDTEVWYHSYLYIDGVPEEITGQPTDAELDVGFDMEHEIVFGNFKFAEVHGKKVIDRNADGDISGDTCDPADPVNYPGCSGVTVFLDGADNLGNEVHETTTTDDNGEYWFTGLFPGSYTISIGEPAGFFCSFPDIDGIDCDYTVDLSSGDDKSGFDFGDFSKAEAHGRKVIDLNGDGDITGDTCNPADPVNHPGCSGVTVNLDGTDGRGRAVNLTTTTGADGGYWFMDLWPGTYTITVVEPAGFLCSFPDPCSYSVTLVSDDVVQGLDFGDLSKAEIHGRKVIDLNADGSIAGDTCPLDPDPWGNNAGCQNVEVHLNGTDGMGRAVDLTTYTNEYGSYWFQNLWPGTYTVTVVEATGFFCSFPDPCSYSVTLVSDQVLTAIDFGDFSLADISAHKFFDLNENGTQDPGEADVSGIEFCLYTGAVVDPAYLISCQTSDGAGLVTWSGLMPGTYTVAETLPTGFFATNFDVMTVTVVSDEIRVIDFGDVANCVGLTPGYWSNWDNHYTEEQFLILLAGTVAEGDVELANYYLSSMGCDNDDALHCMRRFLLANQLTLNLSQYPDLPNPSGGSLFLVCQDCQEPPMVEGNLGLWIEGALAILADPDSFSREEILEVKNALDRFANLRCTVD